MKLLNLFLTFFLISFGVYGQSYGKFGSQSDVEKLLGWAQLVAYEEEIAISYKRASIRNGIIEIDGLTISNFVFPSEGFDRLDSFNAFLSAGSNTEEEFLAVKKIKINIGYLEKLINFARSKDVDMLKSFYKSETYLLFDDVTFSNQLASSAANEFSEENNYWAKKISSYLDKFSLEIGAKAKGKLRSNVETSIEFGDDLSFYFSMDSSVNADSIQEGLSANYFNVLGFLVEPLQYAANQLESFLEITSQECSRLYDKDNVQAWLSLIESEYCLAGLQFLDNSLNDRQFENNLDTLVESFDEDLLYLNELNTKIYESTINIAWSERLFKDLSILSGGTLDAGLFTMKALLSEKLTREEFDQTLGFILLEPEVNSLAAELPSDDLYKAYSDYYFKLKSFATNPKGIGMSVKSKDGLDSDYLLYLAENPLLITGLLNETEIELLLNKRN